MTTLSFAPFADKMRAAGLPQIAIDTFAYYVEKLRAGDAGTVSEADIDPVDTVTDAGTLGTYTSAGRDALKRAVVIKLNGGLGTTMGMTRAKSLLPAKQGLSFLDISVRQILHLRQAHDVGLPLLLMNSFRTRDDSLAVLRGYPELAVPGLPADFLQHKVPRILKSDCSPVAWPQEPEHEWCPPGHGDIYPALQTSGVLDALLNAGFEYAFVSNSDNLGAVLDLPILGWFADTQAPFLMEVADRSEADKKGGHLARRKDGQLILREVAQCPPAELSAFQDITRYRFFNTNNLWVNLRALQAALSQQRGVLGLPMISNEKPVDPADPTSPRVVQLETAMGAAIQIFDGARALRVPRGRLVPVKTTSDLLALWSDVYVLNDDFRIVETPNRTLPPIVVNLDQQYFRRVQDLEARFPHGAPSLRGCRRLIVQGDVRFGRGVTVLGDVTITAPHDATESIGDHTLLRG